jgi:uncharacterized protein YoxC
MTVSPNPELALPDDLLEDASKFVTEQSLETALNGIRQSIQDLGQRVDSKIESARQSFLEEAERRFSSKLSDERNEREKAIQEIREDIDEFGKKTDKRLGEIDSRLQGIDSTLKGVSGGVERLTGTITVWSQAMDASRQLFQQNTEAIDKHGRRMDTMQTDIELLTTASASHLERTKNLHRSIYGAEGEDGPESLFGMLKSLSNSMNQRFDAQDQRLSDVQDISNSNAAAIAVINKERQLWEERKAAFQSLLLNLLTDKRSLAIIGTSIIGVLLGIFPQARESLLMVLETLLK